MTNIIETPENKFLDTDRIIGKYPRHAASSGPSLLISGAVHGNEPSGVKALQRVFSTLKNNQISIKGQLIGVIGNLQALLQGVRSLDHDLNRICTPETAERIRNGEDLELSEEKEFKELINIISDAEATQGYSELLFMDLHTTSSPTHPYISVNKNEDSFQFAEQFPLPVVRGIEKFIPGHFDHFLTLSGKIGFTVESGQHESPLSVDYHEAMIYAALILTEMISKNDFPEWEIYWKKLKESSANQGNFEVMYRHQLNTNDDFVMVPGFKNFDKVNKGQLLAWCNGEPLYSEWDAYIFMPLYQNQGADGFFIVTSCGQ
jgi:succinylglutamate desuccinylase